MSDNPTFDAAVPIGLVLQLDAILAFVDQAKRVAALTSLLVFYLEQHGNCAEVHVEDWLLLCIGPNQPTEVGIYKHAILDTWRTVDNDYRCQQDS